jgi:integrase
MENAVKYMRNFCHYLAQKVVDGKPLIPVVPNIADPNYKKIRRNRKKKKERVITADELKTIVKTAAHPDHQLIVLFMYTMAARITETLELKFGEQIILDRKTPMYRWSDGQNKADLDGWHALHPSLIDRLEWLRAVRKSTGTTRVFPQKLDNQKPLREQQIDWAGWRKRADLGWHWTPHTFRHTCLTNLFSDEKNPQGLICKLYRVSLAVALETYIHPTESSIEKMRNVIEVAV